jgi:hypothetical protein
MSACLTEHRWGERLSVNVPVMLVGAGRTFEPGRVTELSISGARIETCFARVVLANVTLIVLGARSGLLHSRVIRGYVVRQSGGAVNVGWWSLYPATVEQLLAFSAARKLNGRTETR